MRAAAVEQSGESEREIDGVGQSHMITMANLPFDLLEYS
jgi:hypothetical protein